MGQPEEQGYNLTLDTLLTILNLNRQAYQIFAQVSLGTLSTAQGTGKLVRDREKVRSTGVIELFIQNGHVDVSVIRDQNGHILKQGAEALSISRRCGELFWVVRPWQILRQELPLSRVGGIQQSVEVWPGRSPPYQKYRLAIQDLEALPRKHRQVLLLIDGQRGMRELCRILNCTPEQIAPILDELMSLNLIHF